MTLGVTRRFIDYNEIAPRRLLSTQISRVEALSFFFDSVLAQSDINFLLFYIFN